MKQITFTFKSPENNIYEVTGFLKISNSFIDRTYVFEAIKVYHVENSNAHLLNEYELKTFNLDYEYQVAETAVDFILMDYIK